MCNGPPQIALCQVAEDEGEEEAHDGDEADELAALVVGLWHHGAREHRQDGPGGEGLDTLRQPRYSRTSRW